MRHLLKTSRVKVAERRTKGKHYFRLSFAIVGLYALRPAEHTDFSLGRVSAAAHQSWVDGSSAKRYG
jgi:hypothetical protein